MSKYPPFTVEEIKNINDYQFSELFHPLTCGCGDHIKLIAVKEGLKCPSCNRKQGWVHSWIANGSWRRLL